MSRIIAKTPSRPQHQPAPSEMAAMLMFLLVLGGCGGAETIKRAPVSGYVTIDGNPLKSGSIRFVPTGDSKGPAAVATIEDGVYELPVESGPVVGSQRIEIEATNHFGFDLDDEQAYAQQAAGGTAAPANPIPEAFNSRSTLIVEVAEEGASDLDFRLTSAGVLADSR